MGKEEFSAKPDDGSIPDKAPAPPGQITLEYRGAQRPGGAVVGALMLMGVALMGFALITASSATLTATAGFTVELRKVWRVLEIPIAVSAGMFTWGASYILWALLIKRQMKWAAVPALVMVGISWILIFLLGGRWFDTSTPMNPENAALMALLVLLLLCIGFVIVGLWRVIRRSGLVIP
jgi:hypothetical protein